MEPESYHPQSDIRFQSIDRRQIGVDRIVGLIFAGVVALGYLVGVVIAGLTLGINWVWWLIAICGGLVTLFLFLSGYIWPLWEYQRTSWRLSETGLEIRRGVFWRHQISVPVARVQHADVSQGPLQRYFDLSKLTVHTAGTQNASVELNGIAHAQAIQLRDRIVNQRRAADVV